MTFMQTFIFKGSGILVSHNDGSTTFLPEDVVGLSPSARALAPYVEGDLDLEDGKPIIEVFDGYYGRLSAPGYMDCADWVWGNTEAEVRVTLDDLYGG